MEALLAWVVERVATFPREHKFTVGDRLVETCLDITSHLVEASYRRDKHAELSVASRALVRARVLVRLARAIHCVSEAQHHYFATESDELGRMLGGWLCATPRGGDSIRRRSLGRRRHEEIEPGDPRRELQ